VLPLPLPVPLGPPAHVGGHQQAHPEDQGGHRDHLSDVHLWAIDGEGDARRRDADDHGDDAKGEDAAVPGFLSPARGQGQLVEGSSGVSGCGQRQPWFSSLQASQRVGLAAHHVGKKTQE